MANGLLLMKDSIAGKGAPVAEVSGGLHDFFQCLRILNAGAHGGKDQGKRISLGEIGDRPHQGIPECISVPYFPWRVDVMP